MGIRYSFLWCVIEATRWKMSKEDKAVRGEPSLESPFPVEQSASVHALNGNSMFADHKETLD